MPAPSFAGFVFHLNLVPDPGLILCANLLNLCKSLVLTTCFSRSYNATIKKILVASTFYNLIYRLAAYSFQTPFILRSGSVLALQYTAQIIGRLNKCTPPAIRLLLRKVRIQLVCTLSSENRLRAWLGRFI